MDAKEMNNKAAGLMLKGVRDDDNPYFALQTIASTILRMACKGEIDLNELARAELENRYETVPQKYSYSYDCHGKRIKVTIPQ